MSQSGTVDNLSTSVTFCRGSFIFIRWSVGKMVNKEGKVLKPEQVEELQKIISSVKYGSVTLIIQDGVLLQIEKNEKIRLK